MKRAIAAIALATVLPFAAQATTIQVTSFDATDYASRLAGGNFVGTSFESEGAALGEGEVGQDFVTRVGTFNTLGGQGTGGTVRQLSGNTGTELALRDGNVFGRTDQVGGTWFLDSNDTYGISWAVSTGSLFTSVMFVLTDHAEYSTTTIVVDGVSRQISGIGGSKSQLVTILFNRQMASTLITIGQGRNDGFSIDGAKVDVAPVPLPAAGWFLIAGLGGLAALRRAKRAG